MRKKLFLLCTLCMWFGIVGTAAAQSLSSSNNTITQDFNSMYDATGNAATLALPETWRIDRNMDAVRTVGSYTNAATEVMYEGGVSLASNAKNGTWNFQSSSDVKDRAVGGISTGSVGGANAGTRCLSVMTKLSNADANAIEGLKISYDVEKYRSGSNAAGFTVQMYYSTDGATWISAGDDFKTTFTPDAATAGAEVVPISTTGVSEKNLKTTVASGSDLYLAWNISVSSGTTCSSAMALALDNVSITASFVNPEQTKHYIYVENATKWANLYLYASGADEPFGAQPGSQPAGSTNINGLEYKYYEVTTTGTYSLIFSDGGSTNKYDAVSITADKDNYLSVNPLGVDVIADPQTYTGWVDPTRPPFVSSGIFIRGEVNGWGATAEWEFSKEADGLYVLYDKTLNGNFKVADASWSSSCNYGSNGSSILIDTPYSLTLGTDANISCGSNTYTCSKIILTIVDGTATLLLQSDDDETGLTSVYVIGDNNGWNYADASGELKLTATENVFSGQVTMAAGSDNLSHWLIYQKLGMGGAWGNPGNTDATTATTSGTLEKGSKGRLATEPGTYDITFNLSTGEYTMVKQETVIQSVTLMPAEVTLVPTLPETVKVLSLNNSLIHYNDQDFMFNDIAQAMGKDAKWTKHTLLGKSLDTHWDEGEGLAEDGNPGAKMLVRSDAWTHIILQEQSARPRTNVEAFRASVKKWVQYIRENCPNPNAIIIVPMNWAYSGDWDNFTTFNQTFYNNYMDVARETGVTICPVGVAYQNVYDKEGTTGIAPWFQDDRHPTNMSTYMAACMEYALIFGEDAKNINSHPSSITDADAEKMRNYASEALNGFTNYVDHTAGVVRYTVRTLDQFGMEIATPSDITVTTDGGGSLSGTVFTSDNTTGTFTLTAKNAQFISTASLTVAEAETEVINYPAIELNEEVLSASETFDAIGLDAEATLPDAWRIDRQTAGPRLVGSYKEAADHTMYAGGVSLPSNAKNGTWNFGADESDDRAVGGISTGVADGTRCVNVYTHLFNAARKDIENVTISYDIEKYRKGSNPAGFAIQLYYSIDGKNWTSAGENFYTFIEPDAATEGYAEVPGEVISVSNTLNTNLPRGCDFYLAWNIGVPTGTTCNNAMALAIDNFSIEGTLPEIPEYPHYIYVVDETGWAALGLYAYGDGELFGSWPGESWLEEQDIDGTTYKVFALDAESGNYNLIFNNWNNGSQTPAPDFAITADRDYYLHVTADKIEEITTDGIAKLQNEGEGFSVNGSTITYPGMIEVYTSDGRLVDRAANSLRLNENKHGMFIIRATGKNGSATRKVVR